MRWITWTPARDDNRIKREKIAMLELLLEESRTRTRRHRQTERTEQSDPDLEHRLHRAAGQSTSPPSSGNPVPSTAKLKTATRNR